MIESYAYFSEKEENDKRKIRISIEFLKSKSDSSIQIANYISRHFFSFNKNIINNIMLLPTDDIVDILIRYNDMTASKSDIIKLCGSSNTGPMFVLYQVLISLSGISKLLDNGFIEYVNDCFAVYEDKIKTQVELISTKKFELCFCINLIALNNLNMNPIEYIRSDNNIKDNWLSYTVNKIENKFQIKLDINNLTNTIICKSIEDMNESKNNKSDPDIKKHDIDGFVVYQGRNAISNDILTFQWADGDDLWFHVRGYPGSHVVIKVRDSIPTETTIRKVAELAKKNSKAKDEGKVRVVYCKRKFVKKESGMNSGQVLVDSNNSYFLEV